MLGTHHFVDIMHKQISIFDVDFIRSDVLEHVHFITSLTLSQTDIKAINYEKLLSISNIFWALAFEEVILVFVSS